MFKASSIYSPIQFFTNERDLIDELSAYTKNSFFQNNNTFKFRDLEDEPLVADWEKYIEESKEVGVYQILKKYLVQFQFPIKEKISLTDDYKKATLRGSSTLSMRDANGLCLMEPEKLTLFLHPSLAGRIPVIIANNRIDFQSIVRALTYRNEPQPMSESMGAAMIQGLNNWDRLRKAALLSSKSAVLGNKLLYQDRIIVLSRIPYSNVAAKEMNLEQEDWLDKSLMIRLEHECTHYFTLRHFGKMTNNMHDEIIADYMGICSVLPHFNSNWFLRFIGLEAYPDLRADGRIKNYLGKPSLSDPAFKILQTIVKRAADNIEAFDKETKTSIGDVNRRSKLFSLCTLSLPEMAYDNGVELLKETYFKKYM